ncbi:MAG: hypothetical protein ACYC7B_05160 [Burkholderiales bacterium]
MAKILADRDIKRLVGRVLVDAEEKLLNPNGIELRLGKHVRFHSTGEEKELAAGMFLQVNPGETVIISSIETIDFTAETVRTILPNTMIMGLITPTTTMMREGISQVATKIDAGFKGILNWGLRNGSIQKLTLQYGDASQHSPQWPTDRGYRALQEEGPQEAVEPQGRVPRPAESPGRHDHRNHAGRSARPRDHQRFVL